MSAQIIYLGIHRKRITSAYLYESVDLRMKIIMISKCEAPVYVGEKIDDFINMKIVVIESLLCDRDFAPVRIHPIVNDDSLITTLVHLTHNSK